jgi:hypothetical protein
MDLRLRFNVPRDLKCPKPVVPNWNDPPGTLVDSALFLFLEIPQT